MRSAAAFLIGISFGIYATYTYGILSQPITLSEMQSNLDIKQQGLDARIAAFAPHCIKNKMLQADKRGCEEFANYVTSEANKEE